MEESKREEFELLPAEAIIDRILTVKTGRPCITCSFQAGGMVVLDMLRRRIPNIPVLFVDTGYHFEETYAFRDKIVERWRLNLLNLAAKNTVSQQEAAFGMLNRTDPNRCCQLRKVDPLFDELQNYDVWFTGLRRSQSSTRKAIRVVEDHYLPSGGKLLKLNPIAGWNEKQVWRYTLEHNIEFLPLYNEGYTSIGCKPCTLLPVTGADARSGRWGGKKIECGMHILPGQHEEERCRC